MQTLSLRLDNFLFCTTLPNTLVRGRCKGVEHVNDHPKNTHKNTHTLVRVYIHINLPTVTMIVLCSIRLERK